MNVRTGSSRTKHLLLPLAKIGLSAVLLAVLFYNFDFGAVMTAIRTVRIEQVLIAIGLLLAHSVILGGRSCFVLSWLRAPLLASAVLRVSFIGVFFNQLLPSAFGGDGVRAWLLGRGQAGYRKAFSSILLERIAGVLALVVLGVVGTFLIPENTTVEIVRWSLLAGLAVAISGIYAIPLLQILPDAIKNFSFLRDILAIASDLVRLFRSPAALALLFFSVVLHVFAGVAFILLLKATGAEVSLFIGVPLVSLVLLVTLLPFSFGSWGLREGAAVAVFQLIGIAPDAVLAASILFGISLMAASLPGLIFWFLGDRSKVISESATAPMTDISKEKENLQW